MSGQVNRGRSGRLYRPVAPAWAAPYIGIPFADKGRSMDGADCYGLARLIYARELGYELPDVEDYDGTDEVSAPQITALIDQARAAGDWAPLPFQAGIEREKWPELPFDIIEIRVDGFPDHIGVVLEPGVAIDTRDTASGSGLLFYRERLWSEVVIGFRRHQALASGQVQRPV